MWPASELEVVVRKKSVRFLNFPPDAVAAWLLSIITVIIKYTLHTHIIHYILVHYYADLRNYRCKRLITAYYAYPRAVSTQFIIYNIDQLFLKLFYGLLTKPLTGRWIQVFRHELIVHNLTGHCWMSSRGRLIEQFWMIMWLALSVLCFVPV